MKKPSNSNLSEPFSPFLTLLTKPVFKRSPIIGVGTGPYIATQVKKDGSFVDQINMRAIDPNLPDLVINFYPSERVADTAFELGNVQSLVGLDDPAIFADPATYVLESKPNFEQLVTIFYNTKDPVLSDDNFRLALSFAAPSIAGQETAITSIPKTSWVFNSDVKDYLDNPSQTKAYLAKVKTDKNATITLTATTYLAKVGQSIVDEWNKQGIHAKLNVESGVPQNFQALLIAQNIPSDPDQYSLWHSTQTETNISQYSNPRIDKDLEDGRKATDSATRKKSYQDFQKVLLDHAPATPLYFPKYNSVLLKKAQPELEKVLQLQLAD
jgi:peptide/nickel transport system substrate-binding protein